MRKILESRAVAMLLSLCVFLPGCTDKRPPPPPSASPEVTASNTTDPQWIAQATPHAKVAVVFVHGLIGDTLGTWTNRNGKTFFGLLKASPGVGSQVDVFAFGFTSNMLRSGSFDIREASNKMNESLKYHGVLDYPAVVFVAHSMGGLVVLRHLVSHRELLDKVPLIVLYATPQEGAQIAAIGDRLLNNPALRQMFPADGNALLQTLNDDWQLLSKRPAVTCGYEKLPTLGFTIVPWASATRFCNGAPSAISDADHFAIVKPDRLEHDSMVLLVNALNEHVVGKNFTAKLELPDFIPEGDHFVFKLGDPNGKSSARLVNSGRAKLRYTLAEISDPSLYLWPDDTPKELPGERTDRVTMALGYAAKDTEYRFVVRSDVAPDQSVVVRVPDVEAMRAKRAQLIDTAMHALNAHLEKPENYAALAKLGQTDPEAGEVAVKVVQEAIASTSPGLPGIAQWMLAADVLEASNWPQLAAKALRRAEALSPSVARSPGGQQLAGIIASHSGEVRVFANADTPKIEPIGRRQLS